MGEEAALGGPMLLVPDYQVLIGLIKFQIESLEGNHSCRADKDSYPHDGHAIRDIIGMTVVPIRILIGATGMLYLRLSVFIFRSILCLTDSFWGYFT